MVVTGLSISDALSVYGFRCTRLYEAERNKVESPGTFQTSSPILILLSSMARTYNFSSYTVNILSHGKVLLYKQINQVRVLAWGMCLCCWGRVYKRMYLYFI